MKPSWQRDGLNNKSCFVKIFPIQKKAGKLMNALKSRSAESLYRRKIISVDPSLVVMLLNLATQKFQTISLPIMNEIPEGTEVLWAFVDQESNRLMLVVTHPSFDEVFPGERYPNFILGECEWRMYRIESPDLPKGPLEDFPSPFQRPFTNPRSGMGIPKP